MRSAWVLLFTTLGCTRTAAEPGPETPALTVGVRSTEPTSSAPGPILLASVTSAVFEATDCSVEVVPKQEVGVATDWTAAFALMNSDWFAAAPVDERAAQERLCGILGAGDCPHLAPLVLTLGEDMQPAAFRVGFAVADTGRIQVYGPWDAGVQIYHCTPNLTTSDDPAPYGLRHVGIVVNHIEAVRMDDDGVCDDEDRDCVLSCSENAVERFDLYLDAQGNSVLVRQIRRLPDGSAPAGELSYDLSPRQETGALVFTACESQPVRVEFGQ